MFTVSLRKHVLSSSGLKTWDRCTYQSAFSCVRCTCSDWPTHWYLWFGVCDSLLRSENCCVGDSRVLCLLLLLLLCSMWWLRWLARLFRECCILGCQEQILCRHPELGLEGHTSGPYLLPCLVVEWAGLQVMFWRLVRLSTGALSWGLYANPLEMAIQFAVACSEVKDDGLLVSWQLMECILVWVLSSSLAVEDGFLLIMDKSFEYFVIKGGSY